MLIPTSLVPSNGGFCQIVTVEYFLKVVGTVNHCHTDIKFKLPVTIGRFYDAMLSNKFDDLRKYKKVLLQKMYI